MARYIFRDLVLDAAAWIETGEWTHNNGELARALRERPIAAAAAEELRCYRKKILERGAQLDELDPQRRHKLRIQAKKTRYARNSFAVHFPARNLRGSGGPSWRGWRSCRTRSAT